MLRRNVSNLTGERFRFDFDRFVMYVGWTDDAADNSDAMFLDFGFPSHRDQIASN